MTDEQILAWLDRAATGRPPRDVCAWLFWIVVYSILTDDAHAEDVTIEEMELEYGL